jgi:hypothetical protein
MLHLVRPSVPLKDPSLKNKHGENKSQIKRFLILHVIDICQASGHSSSKVSSRQTQDDSSATSHVLATVVATSLKEDTLATQQSQTDSFRYLSNGSDTRVTNAESLGSSSTEERFSIGGSVEDNVAHDDVVL